MIDVASAHIDSCLYHGRAGLDFAERLAKGGGSVAIPTTLNVSSLDLLHLELYRGDPETGAAARRLMDAYVSMGCRQTWTCAPYQLPGRPGFGEHVAWAESNAIVFANSVLGARTDRYGDFIDIAAALTGRVPEAGLHVSRNRAATAVFGVGDLPPSITGSELFFPVLGHLIGRETGSHVPVVVGLDGPATEDDLKAFGAAAASSGAVALFHVVGITPEAPTLAHALQDVDPQVEVSVTADAMEAAIDELSHGSSAEIHAVSVGTPHLSRRELTRLAEAFDGREVAGSVRFYASTGRDVLAAARRDGTIDALERSGVQLVTDTCTYITPILEPDVRTVMTNSAKWAYYAPGNLGLEVVFASLSRCVESAVAGRIVLGSGRWS
jgi:predicted aconitase